MPVIKFNGQQFALQPGSNRLGGSGADVVVGGSDVLAVVDLGPDGKATIRKSSDAGGVKVNGTPLAQPTPLFHGDKVEVAGQELLFADDAKVGATQFVSAADVAAIAAAKRSGPARATAATGGRLVSLVDGKEYAVPEGGVVIGRDASADIVVAQTSVSRRHAQVIAGANGYVLNDLSTNGLFVNGEKVNGTQPLSRSDVIQIGSEQFRFYADAASAAAARPAAAPVAPPPVVPTPAPAPVAAAPAPAPAPPKPAPVAAPAPANPPTPPQRPASPPPAVVAPPTAPRPAAPPPPAAAKPAAPAPKPTTAPAKSVPAPTPAPPAPPAAEAPPQPGAKKTVPMWVGLVILIVAAGAFAAYFLSQPR